METSDCADSVGLARTACRSKSVTITAATSGIWGAKQKCMARAQNVADAPFWMSATTRMMLGPPVVEVSLRAIHLVLTIFRPIVRT